MIVPPPELVAVLTRHERKTPTYTGTNSRIPDRASPPSGENILKEIGRFSTTSNHSSVVDTVEYICPKKWFGRHQNIGIKEELNPTWMVYPALNPQTSPS
jgi:hypothetical protein